MRQSLTAGNSQNTLRKSEMVYYLCKRGMLQKKKGKRLCKNIYRLIYLRGWRWNEKPQGFFFGPERCRDTEVQWAGLGELCFSRVEKCEVLNKSKAKK